MPDNREEMRELSHHAEGSGRKQTTPSPSLAYAVGAGSDPGKRRKHNEDSILAVSSRGNTPLSALPFGLFVVADGIGGHDDGQEASCCAIQAMVDSLLPKLGRFNTLQPEACTARLSEAVQKANEAVYQQNIDLRSRDRKRGLRTERVGRVFTTLTAAMLVGSIAYRYQVKFSKSILRRGCQKKVWGGPCQNQRFISANVPIANGKAFMPIKNSINT